MNSFNYLGLTFKPWRTIPESENQEYFHTCNSVLGICDPHYDKECRRRVLTRKYSHKDFYDAAGADSQFIDIFKVSIYGVSDIPVVPGGHEMFVYPFDNLSKDDRLKLEKINRGRTCYEYKGRRIPFIHYPMELMEFEQLVEDYGDQDSIGLVLSIPYPTFDTESFIKDSVLTEKAQQFVSFSDILKYEVINFKSYNGRPDEIVTYVKPLITTSK